jgi:hypothetical protein
MAKLMTLKTFDSLRRRDFENGATLDEIAQVFKAHELTRDALKLCIGRHADVPFADVVDSAVDGYIEAAKQLRQSQRSGTPTGA